MKKLNSKQQGLTLVEVMVALVLGSLVTLAVIQAYLSVQKNNRMISAMAEVQEKGRFTVSRVVETIRRGGGFGMCKTFRVVDEYNKIIKTYPQVPPDDDPHNRDPLGEVVITVETSDRGEVINNILTMPFLYYSANDQHVQNTKYGIDNYGRFIRHLQLTNNEGDGIEAGNTINGSIKYFNHLVIPTAQQELRFVGAETNAKVYPYKEYQADGETIAPLKIRPDANELANTPGRYETDLSKLHSGALYVIGGSDKCDVFNNHLMYDDLNALNNYYEGLSNELTQVDGINRHNKPSARDFFGPFRSPNNSLVSSYVSRPIEWQSAYSGEFRLYQVGFLGVGITTDKSMDGDKPIPSVSIRNMRIKGDTFMMPMEGGSSEDSTQVYINRLLYMPIDLASYVPYLGFEYGVAEGGASRVVTYKNRDSMSNEDWKNIQSVKLNMIMVSSITNAVDGEDMQLDDTGSFDKNNNMYPNYSDYLSYEGNKIRIKDGRYAEMFSTVVALRPRNL